MCIHRHIPQFDCLVFDCRVLKNISDSVLAILTVNGMFLNYVLNPVVIYKAKHKISKLLYKKDHTYII